MLSYSFQTIREETCMELYTEKSGMANTYSAGGVGHHGFEKGAAYL